MTLPREAVSRSSVILGEGILFSRLCASQTFPLNYQALKHQGIPLSRQIMSYSTDYLTPVYNTPYRERLRRDILHADETTLQMLHEPGTKSQSRELHVAVPDGWTQYRGCSVTFHCGVRIPARLGAKRPAAFLVGFQGYPHMDGHAGYRRFPEKISVVRGASSTRRSSPVLRGMHLRRTSARSSNSVTALRR